MKKKMIFLSVLMIIFVSGCSQPRVYTDSDNDGVYNYEDVCANTPKFAIVDKYGCAIDSDNDGVIDLYDKCKNTPILDIVDSNGCSIKRKITK